MLSDQRQYEIKKWIFDNGKAYISELAAHFSVSTETIRRDLAEICQSGDIKKVHGGAIVVHRPLREDSYEKRLVTNAEEKRAIGRFASSLVRDNDTIAIDSGSGTEAMAAALFGVRNIKVVTNSSAIARTLSDKIRRGDFTGTLIFLGGEWNVQNGSTYGSLTLAEADRYSFDKVFLGATAVSENGVMFWKEEEGVFSASLLRHAAKSYVLADSEKIGKTSYYRMCDLSSLTALITDDRRPLGDGMRRALEDADAELCLCPVGAPKA